MEKTIEQWRLLVIDDKSLSFGAKSLALYLACFGESSRSISEICKDMSVSDKTATKYLIQLEQGLWITREKRFGKNCIYRLAIDGKTEDCIHSIGKLDHSIGNSPVQYRKISDTVSEDLRKRKKAKKWEVPDEICREAWEEFEQHRKEIRKPLTNTARTKAANLIKHLTEAEQRATIDKTIQNRWTGLFPEKKNAESKRFSKTGNQGINHQSTEWLSLVK